MGTVLIENALLIATCDERRTKIWNGSIYISDNQILEVSSEKLTRRADTVIDATGMVVLPGLVNVHHHLFQTLTRNVPRVQNAQLFEWLVGLYEIWREIDAEAVYISAQVGLAELLLSGCTTTADHLYLFPRRASTELIDAEIRAARDLGIRFHPTRGSMSRGRSLGGLPPDDVVQSEDEIMRDVERVVSKYHDPSRFSMCRIALAPCSPFSVTSELMQKTISFARQHGLLCHTHLAETRDEEAYCLRVYGCRPLEYLEKLGWLGEDVWLAHCVYLNDEEVRKLALSGTGVAHCPTSNMRLGSGIAPVRKMIDAGVAVGLGVDGSASNDTSNMLAEARQALLVHRLNLPTEQWLTAEDVIWLATRGGAAVLGRDDLGSVEAGKAADLILIDMRQINFAGAMSDPLAAIVFAQSFNRVDMSIVNGSIVVKDGQLVGLDLRRLVERANEISLEILAKSGSLTRQMRKC